MKKTTKKETTGPLAIPEKAEMGIAEIDFGVPTTAPAKRSKYPFITGPGIEKLADRIVELQDKFDAVADPFKAAKLELIELGFPQFFEVNAGMMEPPSSMIARGTKGGARVTFKDQFNAGDKAAITALLGPTVAAEWFRQQWSIKIDGDQIPPARAGEFIKDLRETMARHGVSHALEIKTSIMPTDSFAIKRHSVFDVKTNLAINKIVPQRASVSTKGVR